MGARKCNLNKILNECDLNFFEGEIKIELFEPKATSIQAYDQVIPLKIFEIEIQSDWAEKFALCCKLVHELCANLQETYKQVEWEQWIRY